MKRSILSFIFLLGVIFSYSQNTIAVQSFEGSGDTWTPLTYSTPPCTVGNDIWNTVASLPGISPSEGNQFWGIRDLDGNCGGTGFETITFPSITISSFSGVTFSFDYNAIGLDNNEDLKYELFYDNVSQGEVIVVNGVGGNSDNTNGWLTETVSIPSSVNNVSVILFARCNNGSERAGFDNVLLTESSTTSITNDNCATSTTLTVGTNNTQNIITGTNVGATSSGQLPNPSCANYQGNDIWYTALVPANGIITVETLDAGSGIDTAIEVYTGNCNNLTQIACHDDNNWPSDPYSKIDLTGLANTTIYIRVWAWSNASSGDFNIVAYSSPPPANNDCVDAQSLIVGTNDTQNIVTGSNVDATDSGVTLNPNCDSYQGGDVWFTADIPASGILNIETSDAGGISDTGLAVYTGSCRNLTQIDCDADSGPGFFSVINLSGLANTTVYIRVWEYQNNNFGEFNIVAYSPECPLTTRWNNSGWNNGTPNSFTSAIINADYDTANNGSFESCDCQINANRTLNIRANNTVTVHNDLTVNGTIEVRHEGSLLMTNDDGQVSVSGTFNVHKTSTILNNFRDFTYWSSPVATTIAQAFNGVDPTRIFEWDVPSASSIGDWAPASGPMTSARGYISEAPNTTPAGGTHAVTFSGIPNNGIIDIPVGYNDDGFTYSDFNLIGNPYPSAINIDNFIQSDSNNEMDGTIWLWTHNTAISNGTTGEFLGEDYATYNLTGGIVTALLAPSDPGGTPPAGNIASGQGFFARTTESGTLSFQNNMRLPGQNSQFFRAPDAKSILVQEKDRVWLNVESNTGGAFNQILVGFFDDATDGYDRGYDGDRLGANWIDFYSKIDTLNYAVQGLGSFNLDKKVSLGFDTYISDPLTYKISIYHIEGVLKDNDLYLVDHELNSIHDLKLAAYEFDVNGEGYFPNRFTLQFTNSVLDIDDFELENNFVVFNEENVLRLKSDTIITDIKVYDILGRLLIDTKPNDSEFDIHTHTIEKGTVLVVNAIFENNRSIIKKIILY